MKKTNSIKTIKSRNKLNYLAVRKGTIFVINKVQKKYKARQG